MLNSMNALNLNYTQLQEEVVLYRTEQTQNYERIEEQRQADWKRYEEDRRRDQEDHRRTFGPIYSYVAHQGDFASMATPPPAPSWYNPTEWGYLAVRALVVEAGMTDTAVITRMRIHTLGTTMAMEDFLMAEMQAGTRHCAMD
ncbi:unnamed protein product [Cuscuta europaea]|uniref:Uncharacterized protein n=1 Tax=Cuscuta europaea TaxID=41803 RepID=A0A9P0ZIX8_CUSEU|nr:unnamed protein product [Cuscuta europaea]